MRGGNRQQVLDVIHFARTGTLLQADPHDWGFTDLTKDQAKEIDARYLLTAQTDSGTVIEEAA